MVEKVGYIPETVVYVCRQPTVFQTHWDGETWTSRIGEARQATSLDISAASPAEATLYQKDVIATFPVPVSSKNLEKRLATARAWAANEHRWNSVNQSASPPAATEIIRENRPFSVQICGLDIRSEGGRAYKVIDTDGHLFDLREDVAFEALMKYGCLPNGYLSCEFLWAVSGSSMKLVRDGSLLHQALMRASVRREQTPIAFHELIPGHMYQTRNLTKKLFAGWVAAPRAKTGWKLVWLDGWPLRDRDEIFKSLNDAQQTRTYGSSLFVSITSDHSMIEDVGDYSDLQSLFISHIDAELAHRLQHAIDSLQRFKEDYKSIQRQYRANGYYSEENYRQNERALTKSIEDAKRAIKEVKSIQTERTEIMEHLEPEAIHDEASN